MTVSSRDTFLLFLAKAWHAMSAMPNANNNDIIAMQDACYDIYAGYVPKGVAPKLSLTDHVGATGLRANMTGFINGVGPGRVIGMQSGNWPAMDQAGMLTQYAQAVGVALSGNAITASQAYLHVYPTGSTYHGGGHFTPPGGHAAGSNWRIGINVEPSSMAAAVTALVPVLDAQNDINHIKFLAPGSNDKCDSVIVYMNKTVHYATVKAAVVGAVAGVNIQDCFSIIWEQFDDGMAEAAEPPEGSFGTYRCAIAVFSYLAAWITLGARPDLDQFLAEAQTVYGLFGITFANPHEQGAVTAPLVDQQWVADLANL